MKNKNKGSDFWEYMRTRLTKEEIQQIEQEAREEAESLIQKKKEEHKKYCHPDCPQQEEK